MRAALAALSAGYGMHLHARLEPDPFELDEPPYALPRR